MVPAPATALEWEEQPAGEVLAEEENQPQ